ncbi:MAG: hypothetical protein U0514_00490 [Candidatus Andersenbacteria bacterium]
MVARSEASRARAAAGRAASVVANVAALPALDGAVVAVPTQLHADAIEELLVRYPNVPIYTESR